MVRKLISLTLALSLALGLGTTALAADVADLFPPINEYNGYADVSDSAWYADAAQVCYETGLMTGTSATTFSPNTTMNITQAASLAVRVYDVLHGGDGVIESPEGTPWYTGSIALARELAQAAGRVDLLSRLNHLSDMATRSEFFGFMSLAVGEELLTPINTITTLPDTDDPYILALYNAGIMSGMDAYGSFSGSLTLRRSEAATMVARIIRPELRQTFTPTPLPLVCQAARVLPTTVYFQADKTVTAQEYLTQAQAIILKLEEGCAAAGMEFNWLNTVGEQTFLAYVKAETLSRLGLPADAKGTDAFSQLDLQVFYSRLLDLSGTVTA